MLSITVTLAAALIIFAGCSPSWAAEASGANLSAIPHPRLLLADAQIPALKARLAEDPALKARYDSLLKSAGSWLKKPIALPDRGGQWWHWYVCKTDGTNLQTQSPTQHLCPTCKKVYSGWPYDDVILSAEHSRHVQAARDLALAFRFTREPRYAEKAREILLAYADKYPGYPFHDKDGNAKVGGGKVGPQTLDESVWLITFTQAADLLWDRLSPADRTRIEQSVLRPAVDVIRRHKMKIHNIQCWKNSAVGLVGLLLDDRDLIADALDSEFGLRQQITQGINSDGQWYEGAWGYHFYTLSALAPLLEATRLCGMDFYGEVADGRSVRRMLQSPIEFAMPDMTLPPFNDSGRVSLAGNRAGFEIGLARYGDPRFADVLRDSKRDSLEALLYGVAPLPQAPARISASRNYPAAGYAILQQGSGKDATWLCLKYGPHGGGHGHPDKLSFILYSRGQMLGFDPGTGKYGAPIHNDWQKTSIAHNTLVVDETSQKPASGQSLAFITGDHFAAALADAGPIYDGITYRRAVAVIGQNLILILDLVESDRPRTLDLALHLAGVWSAAPQGLAANLPQKSGYQYLQDMVQVSAPLPALDLPPLRVQVACVQAPRLLAGTGAGAATTERIPCLLARAQDKSAHVAWAISLDGQLPQLKLAQTSAGAWSLTATLGAQTHTLEVGDKSLSVR